jgi:hypothetical protein
MKTQKVFRKRKTLRKKRSSKKKRTSKRIMIGGRRLTPGERNYLKNLIFEIGPPPERRRDGGEDNAQPPPRGETMRFSEQIQNEIDTGDGDKYQVDTLISWNNFGDNLQTLRSHYPDGFIPYFNQPRLKVTSGLLLGLSGFFTGQSSSPADRFAGIKPPDYDPGWGKDDSDPDPYSKPRG